MAKKNQAEEIATEEALAIAEEASTAPVVEETFEEKQARLRREDYQRRNLQAMAEYEEILSRNGVSNPVHPSRQDPDAAVNQRCCF
jgi:hypothetical protein